MSFEHPQFPFAKAVRRPDRPRRGGQKLACLTFFYMFLFGVSEFLVPTVCRAVGN